MWGFEGLHGVEEVLGIFGEVDHSDLLHKAQMIKGNQAGTLHVWFPYSISLRVGGQCAPSKGYSVSWVEIPFGKSLANSPIASLGYLVATLWY